MTVGKLVSGGRARAKLRQHELATRAGVTHSWVRSLETDRIGQPDPAKLRAVADVLGLDYRELLAVTNQLGAIAAVPPGTGDVGLADLVAAIAAQTRVIGELVEELRVSRLSPADRLTLEAAAAGYEAEAEAAEAADDPPTVERAAAPRGTPRR